jgi:hypothetical protein
MYTFVPRGSDQIAGMGRERNGEKDSGLVLGKAMCLY